MREGLEAPLKVRSESYVNKDINGAIEAIVEIKDGRYIYSDPASNVFKFEFKVIPLDTKKENITKEEQRKFENI